MQSNRLPRRIQYSKLQHGQRPRRSEEALLRSHEGNLEKCSIPADQLETLASDREEWQDVCDEGLAAFNINYDQETEARRAHRDTVTSIPASGPRCHICDRICASEFGLGSHLGSHRPSVS